MSAPQDVNTPPGSPLSEVPITPFPQLQQKPADADATFAHEIFTLIGHEDVSDITVLQAEMCGSIHDFLLDFSFSRCLTRTLKLQSGEDATVKSNTV
jgi:hypothetical protein